LGFIAVGWTGGLSSRRFIGRYKSLEELRDVFRLDRLTSAVSRRLYLFKECEVSEECMWLISFDIKLVKVRRPDRSSRLYREPSHEYSIIKEMMYSRLCGSVDMSTYICFENESDMVREYLEVVAPGFYRLESYHVRPYDDKTWEHVKWAFEETVDEFSRRAEQLAASLRSRRPGKRAGARARAQRLLERLRSALEVARKHKDKIGELGEELESELEEALEALEEAYHTYIGRG
jgi:hypothetical protein